MERPERASARTNDGDAVKARRILGWPGQRCSISASSAASLAFRVIAAMESPPPRCRVCSLPGWSSWFPASAGLEPADLTGVAASGPGAGPAGAQPELLRSDRQQLPVPEPVLAPQW